jgi:hypothetical protein
MKISLAPQKMLGHWNHENLSICEFQIGRVLIFVEHPVDEPADSSLLAAEAEIEAVYLEINEAIKTAKLVSSKRHPEFWSSIDSLIIHQEILTALSIRFSEGASKIIYEISWNPEFSQKIAYEIWDTKGIDAASVPKQPDDEEPIFIQRVNPGSYLHVA